MYLSSSYNIIVIYPIKLFMIMFVCCNIIYFQLGVGGSENEKWCGYFNYGWTTIVQDDSTHVYNIFSEDMLILLHNGMTWFSMQQQKTNICVDLSNFQLGCSKSKSEKMVWLLQLRMD